MNSETSPISQRRAFSLVEVLAAVAIIGIISFLALPNLIQIRMDSERNLAISRAESVNMAIVSYIQANGRDRAVAQWATKTTDQQRYELLAPYMAFSPTNFTDFMPSGYVLGIQTDITALTKAGLAQSDGTAIYY